MKKKEKFELIGEKMLVLQAKLRNECIEYLTRVLKENANHIEWNDEVTDDCISVTYDGGNHPEYASNAFSVVYAINMDENGITLETEDCSAYDIDSVPVSELYELCDFVKCLI